MAVDKDGFFFVGGQKKRFGEREKEENRKDGFVPLETNFSLFFQNLQNLVARNLSIQVGWHVT